MYQTVTRNTNRVDCHELSRKWCTMSEVSGVTRPGEAEIDPRVPNAAKAAPPMVAGLLRS